MALRGGRPWHAVGGVQGEPLGQRPGGAPPGRLRPPGHTSTLKCEHASPLGRLLVSGERQLVLPCPSGHLRLDALPDDSAVPIERDIDPPFTGGRRARRLLREVPAHEVPVSRPRVRDGRACSGRPGCGCPATHRSLGRSCHSGQSGRGVPATAWPRRPGARRRPFRGQRSRQPCSRLTLTEMVRPRGKSISLGR